MERRFRHLAVEAARAAEEKKGEHISLKKISAISTLADFVLVVSANSSAHMRAIQEKIEISLKGKGFYALHRDGAASDLWKVLDYGGIIIHIMDTRARDFFSIDKIYREAREIRWKGVKRKRKKV